MSTDRPQCMICQTRNGLRRISDNVHWVCQRHADPTDPAMGSAVPTQSLNEALSNHGLRLAQWQELKPQRWVLECGVCGDVEEIQLGMQVIGHCVQCRTSYQRVSPRFWVLLSNAEPVPEEEDV